MNKDEQGRKKVEQYTRYITVALAVVQAYGFALFTESLQGAVVTLEIEPGSACAGGASDSLTFAIDVRVFRARDALPLSQKSLGGGLKGMRAQLVDNAAQYKPVYEAWMKAQAGAIYWAVVEALLKSQP